MESERPEEVMEPERAMEVEEKSGGEGLENFMPEVLAEIFRRVPFEDRYFNVGRVCKGWHRAVQSVSCWTEVDMESWFEKRADSICWFRPKFHEQLQCMIRNVVTMGAPQLRKLSFQHCSDQTLMHIASRCPLLQVLNIQRSMSVSDASIKFLASKCPELESLDLSDCRGISAVALASVGQNCKSLIELKRNLRKDDENQQHIVGNPGRNYGRTLDGDAEIYRIATSMPQLEVLEYRNSNITDDGLAYLGNGCTQLESLDLRGSPEVTHRGLRSLEEKLTSLAVFHKPIVTETSVERYGHWQLYDQRFSHFFVGL